MSRICVYDQNATDYSTNGLGTITPTSCTVYWVENGEYSLEIEHPIDEIGKYERLCAYGRTVVVPVPVRDTPMYEFVEDIVEGGTATVQRRIYRVKTNGGRLHLRQKPSTSAKILAKYEQGTEVMRLADVGGGWFQVSVLKGGATGYMYSYWLQYVRTITETVSQGKVVGQKSVACVQSREQPFDIYAWEPSVDYVTAKARHVFWRLAGNLVCSLEIKNKTAQQAMDALFAAAEFQDHGFTWHCEATEAMSLENEIEGKNLVDAILGEGGICDTYGLKLMVDWFDIFLLKDTGEDRGVQIRYGKNLIALTGGFDISNVVTRVVPVGQTKDGKPLYLSGTKYLEGPNAGLYREPIYGYLKVSDAKVGSKLDDSKSELTTAQARTRMQKAAQAEIDAGCDLPDCSLTVNMAQLRFDPAYAEYKDLEVICPGDTLGLFVPNFGLALNVRMAEYEYDALSGRYTELTIGSPSRNMSNSGITSRQLGGASVTSSKLAAGAVGSSAMQDKVVSARHMQAESVNAEAIQADAVSTRHIAAHSVTANELAADAISADMVKTAALEAIAAYLMTLDADSIYTDELSAQLARVQTLIAGTADFDQATIQHLVAQAMNLEFGVAGEVFIKNLAVQYANIVSASIGNLVIKAADGNYYQLTVDENGNVTATRVSVTEGEITAGQTESGEVILETNITADRLNTGDLLATYALINKIDAARIDVDELMAREAFIDLLTTSNILGGKSLKIITQELDDTRGTLSRWFTFDNERGFIIRKPAYTDADGVEHAQSIWSTIVDEVGYHIQRSDLVDYVASFYRDRLKVKAVEIEGMLMKSDGIGGIVFIDAN